jgi:flagellar biosynthesis anti-sigma factor FlgM
MNLRIQDQGQSVDPSTELKSGGTQSATASGPAKSSLAALSASNDTASISAATSQLSGDVAIRQDRVDALRSQIESGTYTVAPHAVATAMFQNLFRS